MNSPINRKTVLHCLLIFFLCLISGGCAVSRRDCVRENTAYCQVRGNFTGQWYDFYERALSCMEGGCYPDALADLEKAISLRFGDQRRARTVGMHFIDYFPHREKGLLHFLEGNPDRARAELELSFQQYPSEKASFYLDKVRQRLLRQTGEKAFVPRIVISSPVFSDNNYEIWTKDDPLVISGYVSDEQQFVSEILLGGQQLFMEKSGQQVHFSEELKLDQGRHEIRMSARNLLGGEAEKTLIVHADRSGPLIIVQDFRPGLSIRGILKDESGEMSLWVNGKKLPLPKDREVPFQFSLAPDEQIADIRAGDRLGNESRTVLGSDAYGFRPERKDTLLAGNDILWDGGRFPAYAALQNKKPQIRLEEPDEGEICFRENLNLKIRIASLESIEDVRINGNPLPSPSGKLIAFDRFFRLKEGENRIRIQARDSAGNSARKNIIVYRKIPRVFQLKYRYGLSLHPLESSPGGSVPAVFQQRFLEDMLRRRRFQISMPEELTSFFQKQNIPIRTEADPASVRAVLLGLIYESREGIEIAVRMVDIRTRETLATADVYHETSDFPTLKRMAQRLSEKLHREFPLTQYRIVQIKKNRVWIRPEKADLQEKISGKTPPLIVYRQEDNPYYGADTDILTYASTEQKADDGSIAIVLEDTGAERITMKDKAVSQ